MTAHYDKFGVKFLYPENWIVNDEQLDEWPRSVSVQSPGGGFWQLNVYPDAANPRPLCDEVLDVLRQEYDDLEAVETAAEIENYDAVGYDMNFYCLDFLVSARVLGIEVGDRTFLLVSQAESREFEQQSMVFEAITRSLLMESGSADESR